MFPAKPIPNPVPDDVKARFGAKVDVRGAEECWPWLAARNAKGYGRVCIGRQSMAPAHRLSFVMAGGELSCEQVIDHLCRNPSCVNPAHLEAATSAENVRRGNAGKNTIERGKATTHCLRGHAYTPENTVLNRNGARSCRECGIQRRRRDRLLAKQRQYSACPTIPTGDEIA